MARFDTFVFDLDGTLLDTLPDLVVLTNAALSEQGFPSRTADEIHSFVGNGARALMYQAVPADASPEQAEAVCAAIRATLADLYGAEVAEEMRVLYGGSMNPGNVEGLMAQPNIDGGLIGGASLKAASFVQLINACL